MNHDTAMTVAYCAGGLLLLPYVFKFIECVVVLARNEVAFHRAKRR